MKREDQITQAALDYCRQYKDSKYTAENAAFLAFSDGAQWADENPKTSTLAEASRKTMEKRHIGVNLENRYTLLLNGEFVATSNSLPNVQEIYDTMLLEINEGDKLTIIRRRNYKPF